MSDCQYGKGTALYGRCLTASTARALLCMADVWLPVRQGHCSVWPMSDCQYGKGAALYGRCLTASTARALLCMADVWLPVHQVHCSVWPMSDCQYGKGTALYGRCLTASTARALLCMADVWLPVRQGHCSVWPMSDCQYGKGTALYGRCLTASTPRALLCMVDVWLPVPQGHCSVWPRWSLEYNLPVLAKEFSEASGVEVIQLSWLALVDLRTGNGCSGFYSVQFNVSLIGTCSWWTWAWCHRFCPAWEPQELNSAFLFSILFLLCFSVFHSFLFSLSFFLTSPFTCIFFHNSWTSTLTEHHLIGLVVKASALRAEDPEFESRLLWDFSGVESCQWIKSCHSSGYPARHLAL